MRSRARALFLLLSRNARDRFPVQPCSSITVRTCTHKHVIMLYYYIDGFIVRKNIVFTYSTEDYHYYDDHDA